MKQLLVLACALAMLFLCACAAGNYSTAATISIATTEQCTTEDPPSPPKVETKTLMETDTLVVFEKTVSVLGYSDFLQEIWAKDKVSGKEALLLGRDDVAVPFFISKINTHYFIYRYAIPDTDASGNSMIYDLKKMKPIEIVCPFGLFIYYDTVDNKKIYFEGFIEEFGPTKRYYINIADLENEPVKLKEFK